MKAALLFIAACSSAIVAQTPAPTSSPPPVQPPSASPSPTASLTATPMPSPFATPTVLMLPPDAPPQILWFGLSTTTPRAGDTLTVTVLASSNVASVEIRVGGYGFSLPKTDVGRFEGSYAVPHLPFFVSRNMTMRIIARNTAGAATESSIAMQIQ